jgi:tRNA pseudouridine-54 N-methylase
MKHTVEIEFETTVKAVLRGQDLTASVTVSLPYGSKRSVSVSEESLPAEATAALKEALGNLQSAVLPKLLARAQAAAHQALEVAVRNNEKV